MLNSYGWFERAVAKLAKYCIASFALHNSLLKESEMRTEVELGCDCHSKPEKDA